MQKSSQNTTKISRSVCENLLEFVKDFLDLKMYKKLTIWTKKTNKRIKNAIPIFIKVYHIKVSQNIQEKYQKHMGDFMEF
jgi:hypothetical protein